MNKKIPENYQTVMPYLVLANAADFSRFMQKVFEAKETYRELRDEGKIAHAELMIGGSTIMFADHTDIHKTRPGNLFIYVDNVDETYRKAIEAGGKSVREIADLPFGRNGGIADPFGNNWWITSPL